MGNLRLLKAAMTISMCDVMVPFSKKSTEAAIELSSMSARFQYLLAKVETRGGAPVESDLEVLCPVVAARRAAGRIELDLA